MTPDHHVSGPQGSPPANLADDQRPLSRDYREIGPNNSSSGTNVVLIVLGIIAVLILGGGMLIIVCLAAITTIGTQANATFTTVGSSISSEPAKVPLTRLADPEGIRRVLDEQVEAWNKGDLEGFMEGYWRSPELTFYSEDRPRRGWDETYARYKERYQDGGKEMGKLSFGDLKIEMIGSGQALVRGEWKLKLKDGERGGLFTLVMKQFPEGWRITHDHTSGPREMNP